MAVYEFARHWLHAATANWNKDKSSDIISMERKRRSVLVNCSDLARWPFAPILRGADQPSTFLAMQIHGSCYVSYA